MKNDQQRLTTDYQFTNSSRKILMEFVHAVDNRKSLFLCGSEKLGRVCHHFLCAIIKSMYDDHSSSITRSADSQNDRRTTGSMAHRDSRSSRWACCNNTPSRWKPQFTSLKLLRIWLFPKWGTLSLLHCHPKSANLDRTKSNSLKWSLSSSPVTHRES